MFTFRKPHNHQSDDALIEAYLENDDLSALDELFRRYSHLVFFVCQKYLRNSEDSKDAVLEIFENIIGSLRRHEVNNFKSWLYSVTKRHCLMKLRRTEAEKLILKKPEEIENIFMENRDFMHLLYGNSNKPYDIESALNKLEPKQRECVRLFYYERMSYQEIVEQTGFDLKQVKSSIQNGKRNLKKILTRQKGH
jgi:RNA polymerase sigma factor (sigma-70 family)